MYYMFISHIHETLPWPQGNLVGGWEYPLTLLWVVALQVSTYIVHLRFVYVTVYKCMCVYMHMVIHPNET